MKGGCRETEANDKGGKHDRLFKKVKGRNTCFCLLYTKIEPSTLRLLTRGIHFCSRAVACEGIALYLIF